MKRILGGFIGLALAALPGSIPATMAQDVKPAHGIAMLGEPKYGPDFTHLDYANPDAPKGGAMVTAAIGTFDSFNPFTLQGTPGPGAGYETLTTQSLDEPFSEYGLIAESIEVPEDRSWVAFNLRPQARWHDGQPITADDVVFSFNLLKEKGPPFYRSYFSSVATAEKLGDLKVKFTFVPGDNRELPLIMGQLPVLPQHSWKDRDITKPSLDVPLGSGPYKIASFEPGRSITLQRVADYWGKDLPINVGQDNIDTLRYDYYRDGTVALEAFKAHAFDFRREQSAKNWATAYDIPAVKDGRIVLEKIPTEGRNLMQGYVFNLRKPMFQDPKVREALQYAFDFEWANKALFYGQYVRIRSYFGPSELGATGLPSPEELKILEPYRGKIPDEVFTTEYNPPKTDGSGDARANLQIADRILTEAGWELKDGVRQKNGVKLDFEFLLDDPTFERVTLPVIQNLEQLGVKARLRTVDTAQYQKRTDQFDFDVTVNLVGQSLSPGNEQRDFWGSKTADETGSRNLGGLKDPVVDDLVEKIIAAKDRDTLVNTTRVLDRVLQWGFYYIPHWNAPFDRVAYWNKYAHPTVMPKYGLTLDTWWVDPAKEAALTSKIVASEKSGEDAGQNTAATEAPPPATAPAATAPAATAPAAGTPAPVTPITDRGSTPIPYILGGIAAAVVAFMLGRRGRK